MDDAQLFHELARVYGLREPVIGDRQPNRVAGFPGLITLRPERGPAIVLKQDNSDSCAISTTRQHDIAFHQRCFRTGIPASRPVFAVDGSHGAVFDPLPNYPDEHLIFTASQWVDGMSLLEAQFPPAKVKQTLQVTGRAAALLRVASRNIGPWARYPWGEAYWVNKQIVAAQAENQPWADQFAKLAHPLEAAAATLPLGSGITFIRPSGVYANLAAAPRTGKGACHNQIFA